MGDQRKKPKDNRISETYGNDIMYVIQGKSKKKNEVRYNTVNTYIRNDGKLAKKISKMY